MRTNIWPFVGRWFTTIIKSGPNKTAQTKLVFGCQFPPGLGFACPPRMRNILVGNITTNFVFFINSSGGNGASHFGSQQRLAGMISMIIGNSILTIIETTNRNYLVHSLKIVCHIGSIGCRSGWIQFLLNR